MNTIHGYNEVHITYDLTKMLRSIKRCEKREEEENELRSRINAYRSHRAELCDYCGTAGVCFSSDEEDTADPSCYYRH